jgi:stearoyl-CoA desaturase (delta-9 desaturase)
MISFIVAFVIAYGWGVLGISLGYHRGLSHRSFKLPQWLEYFFIIGAYLVFEGGPIFWVASHRLHHRYSDQPGDPHSPKDGVWHSILGWMSKPTTIISEAQYKTICPDLFKDKFYCWLHAGGNGRDGYLCLTINVALRLVLLAVFGPWALLGNLLGSVGAFIAPLLVNSICHMPKFGYQNFKTTDLSQNVWFVALASFGEGWHNNHHEYPQSARHGMKPWEYDFSYSVLRVLEVLGIARNIRLPKIALGTRMLQPLDQNVPDPTRELVADEPTLDGSPSPVLEPVAAYSRQEYTKTK